MQNEALKKHLDMALQDIGDITPWWSEDDGMFVFEHAAYPRVMYADPDKALVVNGYRRALSHFIEARLSGKLSVEADKVTSGRGGYRVGAGRPKKQPTTQVRVPDDILDVVNWLRQDPSRAVAIRRLMQA